MTLHFERSSTHSHSCHEAAFIDAFCAHHGFGSPKRWLISYSVSCLALSLATVLSAYERVWVEVPSFDNIRDLLKRSGLPLHAFPEGFLREKAIKVPRTVVWIANPNNPTGHYYSADELAKIGAQCAANNSLLVLDSSFRSFGDKLLKYNYERLFASERRLRWLVLEDTGKYLPVQDIKVGFAYSDNRTHRLLETANLELLLGVSPVVLAFLTDCYVNLDGIRLREGIDRNRRAVTNAVQQGGSNWTIRSNDQVPLVWLRGNLGEAGRQAYSRLQQLGISVLPGDAFYEDPNEGSRFCRIALNRDAGNIDAAVHNLRSTFGK